MPTRACKHEYAPPPALFCLCGFDATGTDDLDSLEEADAGEATGAGQREATRIHDRLPTERRKGTKQDYREVSVDEAR